ncbi:serine hydrolase domain-containing protein [Streptomyces sp. SBT349]|uniref:serine hydrolase domain-containing protein n=1 Tax=Streptomyces sp. SBT349 TaxID=1580539 RepID=UPI00099DD89D|nr:serine hydrolase domain-containing protein [Streptomyces sp. SBT349]
MNATNTPTASTTAGPVNRPGEPGVILCLRTADGPLIHTHTGSASLELAAPIGENTAFNVGSVAKQITAYLCIRTARDGLLALDRPVGDILPRFRIPDVTVSDLIQHRSGIRDAETLLSLAGFRDLDHYTADDLLQLAYRQQHRAVTPGRFLYSNTGYLLLAEVLAQVHGAGLQQVAEQQVFAPLGMTARFKTDLRDVIPGAAAGYQSAGGGWQHEQRPVTLPGPGSLWSTAADLDRWLGHLWDQWSESADDGLPYERYVGYRPSDHLPFTYGPGLYADTRPGHVAVFHCGHEQGFSAAAHLSRAGLRIICLSNHAGIAADHVAAVALAELARAPEADLTKLLHLTLRRQPGPPPTVSDRSGADTPHTPLGTYACDEVPGALRLTRSESSLYLWRSGTRDRLTRTGAATYAANGYTLTVPTAPAGDSAPTPDSFILDLDRAPGLRYRRRPD